MHVIIAVKIVFISVPVAIVAMVMVSVPVLLQFAWGHPYGRVPHGDRKFMT